MNKWKMQIFFMTGLIILLLILFIKPVQSLAESNNGTAVQSEARATFVYEERRGDNEGGGDIENGNENTGDKNVEDNITEDANGDIKDSSGDGTEENNRAGNQELFPQTGDLFEMKLIILNLILSLSALLLLLKLRKNKRLIE